MRVGLIFKIRHYVPKFPLRTPYFTLFNTHLIYACQVWGQDPLHLRRLSILQNKALRIINFKEYDYPTNDLYHESKILKIEDYIKLLNCFFVKDVLEKTSIKIFQNFFIKTKEVHNHTTRHSSHNNINCQQFNIRQDGQYGKYLILKKSNYWKHHFRGVL